MSTAQWKYDRRWLACVKLRKAGDFESASLVMRMIVEGHWSSEQIAGCITLERLELPVSRDMAYRCVDTKRLGPPGLMASRGASA